jgi:hypothetical protein
MTHSTPLARLTIRRLMIAVAVLAVFLASAIRMPWSLWPLTVLTISALWVAVRARRREAWGDPMTVVEMSANLFLVAFFSFPLSFAILLIIDWAFPMQSR